jgi:outer membrane receptor protein involved in Fe transport
LGRTGGNPNLENEKADSWTVGATIEPSIIPNLLLTVDYIKIDIEDAITSLNLTQIMRACYDAPTPTSSNPACSQFTRDSDGEIVDFLTGQTNAQIFNHASLTYRAAYGFDVANVFGANADYGGIDFNFNLHHTLKRNTSVVGEMPQPTVGSFTVPRMSATFDTTWRRNNLRLFWRTLWRPAATIDLTGTRTYEDADGDVITKAGGLLLHNASISYALDDIFPGGPKSTAIQLSVNNVFDSKPDTEELALGYFTLAQQLGRSFSIRLRGSF